MKKRFSSFLFIALLFLLVSWKVNNHPRKFNSNTWCISIGEKDLLIWTKHQMGDAVGLRKKTLRPTDFIHAQRFLCGQSANNATTIITVKNNFNKIIKEYKFNSYSMMFEGDIPVKDIMNEFTIGETISIYFTIFSEKEGLSSTVLLGGLKLE